MTKKDWKKAVKEHRYGRFTINRRYIDDTPHIVAKLMSQLIILRGECLYATDGIKYIAISPHFDAVDPGNMIPEYIITTNTTNPKKITFSFRQTRPRLLKPQLNKHNMGD